MVSHEKRDYLRGFRKLYRNDFLRNVAAVASGTAAAQLVTLIFIPVTTRLYGPEAYGLMGTFAAVITILAPLSAFTYPIAVVLPKENAVAKKLISLSIYISILLALILMVLLIFFKRELVSLFQLNEISNFLYLFPLIMIFSALAQTADQWTIRTKKFKVKAKVTLLNSIIIEGGKALVGILFPHAYILIAFTTFKDAVKAILYRLFTKGKKVKQKVSYQKSVSYKKLMVEYRDFPLYRAPQAIIFSISQALPILMLASLFGAGAAGHFSLGRMVLSAPVQLIGKSVADVFYPKVTNLKNNGANISKVFSKTILGLSLLGIIPFGIIVIWGPFIFELIFGRDWLHAGEYARWIALMSYFMFITRPVISVIPVLKLQKELLIYELVSTILRVTALYVGYNLFESDIHAVALFSISSVILYIVLILYTFIKSRD